MPKAKGKIYATPDEMVAAVAKETGVEAEDVRKVLRASFESTKDYVLRELGELAQEEPKKRDELSEKDLEKVAGGATMYATSIGSLSFRQLNMADLRQRLLGAINA